jgi:hypothetical protein
METGRFQQGAARDANRNSLDGGMNYRLHLPPDITAKNSDR